MTVQTVVKLINYSLGKLFKELLSICDKISNNLIPRVKKSHKQWRGFSWKTTNLPKQALR